MAKQKVDFGAIRERVAIVDILRQYHLYDRCTAGEEGLLEFTHTVRGQKYPYSFLADPERQKWKAWDRANNKVGEGSIFDFVMLFEKVDVYEAAKLIAHWFPEGATTHGEEKEQSAEVTTLLFVAKNGDHIPAEDEEVVAAAASILLTRMYRGEVFSNVGETKQYLCCRIGSREQEVFCTLFLDNRHRLISFDELFNGTIDGASVHPREVVKRALHHNAAAVIFAHNHPSGVPEPSKADESLTRRLKEALSLVDVRVLDHIIVAGGETASFAERGLL